MLMVWVNHMQLYWMNYNFALYRYYSLFSRHDGMGIPYTVILDEETINTGIAAIRDRNTTLKVRR